MEIEANKEYPAGDVLAGYIVHVLKEGIEKLRVLVNATGMVFVSEEFDSVDELLEALLGYSEETDEPKR